MQSTRGFLILIITLLINAGCVSTNSKSTNSLSTEAAAINDNQKNKPTSITSSTSTVNVYHGSYICRQGSTRLKLTLNEQSPDQIEAIFTFDAPDGKSGSFKMQGRYLSNNSKIILKAGDWISRPSGYGTVNMSGSISNDKNVISGTIDTPGCSTFRVAKNGSSTNPATSTQQDQRQTLAGGVQLDARSIDNALSSVDYIEVPDQYLIKTQEGCHLINPKPVSGETVSWTGKCNRGLANGHGTKQWTVDGKKEKAETTYMENGWDMKPFSPGGGLVTSKRNSGCRFSLPLAGAERLESLFDVSFVGKCPEGGGTLIHEVREDGEALIKFNNKPFAKYKGKFARGAIPVDGELIFYTGTKFVFSDKVSFKGIITPSTLSKWSQNTSVVRGKGFIDKSIESLFNIKVSFNATKHQPVEKTSKAFILSVDTIASSSELKMNYRVSPIDSKKLTRESYVITLNAVVDVSENISMGGWGAGGDKYTINQNIDIIVNKADGFKKSSSLTFSELDTYLNGLGVTRKVKVSKPKVSLVSIAPYK